MFLVTVSLGRVTGEEFSPDTFQRRLFEFYRLPFSNIRISPIYCQEFTGELEKMLSASGHVGPVGRRSTRWETSRYFTGQGNAWLGDSHILCSYLDAESSNGKESVWLKWSRDNPKMAKLFWPHIGRLAHRNLYLLIPDAMGIPAGHDTVEELDAAMKSHLAKAYMEAAKMSKDNGDLDRASEIRGFLLTDQPDDTPANKGQTPGS